MLYPIKVIDIELSQPIPTIEGLEGYMGLQGLVRLHGVPLGYVKAPISLGKCTAATLSKLILEEHSEAIIAQLLKNGLASPHRPADFKLEDLINLPPVEYAGEWPLVTVAVCTRDRPEDMKLCLEAIKQLDYPHIEILVVDNAPQTEATKDLVKTRYTQVRYVQEPRPGLDWARNRAALEAKGEIIAYTDDDVVVDVGWIKGLAKVFAESPDVMAVTGLVVPYELETRAQVLFEEQGGFGKGFERKWYRVAPNEKLDWGYFAPGRFGTGANMAYRRTLFSEIGYFDPALDVGTVTNGGGDLEMFFRTLKEGHTLVYEPTAIVRHHHRRDYEKLRSQLTHNGSIVAHLVRTVLHYPDELLSCVRAFLWWINYLSRFLAWSYLSPVRLPSDLILPQIRYSFQSIVCYFKARQIANQITKEYGSQDLIISEKSSIKLQPVKQPSAIAIRSIELTDLPLKAITNVEEYLNTRIFLLWQGSAIGSVDLRNKLQTIAASRLISEIVKELGLKLLQPNKSLNLGMQFSLAYSVLKEHYETSSTRQSHVDRECLPSHVKVSIVIATLDRPDDLRNCLKHLDQQKTSRPVEIVIVDNNPASGLTPPVLVDFPHVILLKESRRGLAYARNLGFAKCTGDIAIATDDDVTVPPDWIEKIAAPFSRQDVMVVTSNVLPLELETQSQCLFEEYADGGLGRGFKRKEASGEWFNFSWRHAVPTWRLGATANAAFRCSIFNHSQIGLMNEALGPGMPSGVGEDIYLFYKVLKAGYSIVYEPGAFVFHKHRQTMKSLRRQLSGYSKGIVSYHLTTLFQDHDQRAIGTLLIDIPLWHAGRIKALLQGKSSWPFQLQLIEMANSLVAPWAIWQSYRRVKVEGRSEPYIPVSQRTYDYDTKDISNEF